MNLPRRAVRVFRPPYLAPLCVGLVCAVLGVGCGGEDDEPAGNGDEAVTPGQAGEKPTELTGKPLALPKPKESIEEAAARIEEAIASEDCDVVNELHPLGRPQLRTDERCEALRKRLDFELASSDEFDGGGVLDYENGTSAVLILDADGLHHIALIDSLLEGESAGTNSAGQFDNAAKDVVAALEQRDCDAFIDAAHRRYGPGAAPERETTCTFVENNPITTMREQYPRADLESLGGNADYALYGFATPAIHLTLVMARQDDPESLPETLEPLPKDAAEYGFVGLFVTNRRNAAG